jgi:hypothetical protein
LEVFHATCPAIVTFPLQTLFLSAFRRFSFGELNFLFLNPARVIRTVLIRSSNQMPFWQLRFAQARNLPELLDSVRNGFSSLLAARFHLSRY